MIVENKERILVFVLIFLSVIILGLLVLNSVQMNKKIVYNNVELKLTDYKIISEKINEPFVVCNMKNYHCNIFVRMLNGKE